ncbi:hypothetical protein ACFLZG_04380 [Thermodesulfobacteriota bacterium]
MKYKLCKKNNKLLKKSHIISEFVYKELFDEKHRLYEALINPNFQVKSKPRQSGAYDKKILCEDCDNKVLGGLERYASLVFFGGIELDIKKSNLAEDFSIYLDIKGVDYIKFKLFLLSILWGAGISSLPIFSDINLGKHQEILRDKIISNNPGNSNEYLCAIFTYLHNKQLPHQIVAKPGAIINGEQRIYAFLISGILFVFLC